MKITVYCVTTCIPEAGETEPCQPSVFATEAEAAAFLEVSLRAEWDINGPYDDQGEHQLPYPGTWQEANDRLVEANGEGSWGQWQLTSHEIEIALPAPVQTKLAGIIRLSEARDFASTNFQLNTIADQLRGVIDGDAA